MVLLCSSQLSLFDRLVKNRVKGNTRCFLSLLYHSVSLLLLVWCTCCLIVNREETEETNQRRLSQRAAHSSKRIIMSEGLLADPASLMLLWPPNRSDPGTYFIVLFFIVKST